MRDGSFAVFSPGETVRLNYFEWGPRRHWRHLFCVHGITRQGRDFDELAKVLQKDYRVICPDIVGRGRSGWFTDKSLYAMPTYVEHMGSLIEHLAMPWLDWIGTSMGGIVGMFIAAERPELVRKLVLNDIGPFVPKSAGERVAQYIGQDPRFMRLGKVADYLKTVHAEFGPLTDAMWSDMTVHSVMRQPDGEYALHYDPGIGQSFKAQPPKDIDLWKVWDRIQCPVLVLRGAESQLLTPETADAMRKRGPGATVVEIPDCGHAPSLMFPEQIAAIRDFLKPDEVEKPPRNVPEETEEPA
jgi:pimeloyl-ACP methyl ester carboxylesterase